MTFEEAVEICKDFGGGLLLDGLELIEERLELERDEDIPSEITREERMAFYIVVREMRPLFA